MLIKSQLGEAFSGVTAVAAAQKNFQAKYLVAGDGDTIRWIYVSAYPVATSSSPLVSRCCVYIGEPSTSDVITRPGAAPGDPVSGGRVLADFVFGAGTRSAGPGSPPIPINVWCPAGSVVTVEVTPLDDGGGGVEARVTGCLVGDGIPLGGVAHF